MKPKQAKPKTDDLATLAGRALRRSAKQARVVAKQHGTPVYVWKNGKVVAEKAVDAGKVVAEKTKAAAEATKEKAQEWTTTKEELALYDSNKDGKLDPAERAAMTAAKEKAAGKK